MPGTLKDFPHTEIIPSSQGQFRPHLHLIDEESGDQGKVGKLLRAPCACRLARDPDSVTSAHYTFPKVLQHQERSAANIPFGNSTFIDSHDTLKALRRSAGNKCLTFIFKFTDLVLNLP